MPRTARFSNPKYPKHRAIGQAIVTIAGCDQYLGPHGTKASRIEHDPLIAKWLATGRPTYAEADLAIAGRSASGSNHQPHDHRSLPLTLAYRLGEFFASGFS